MCGLYTNGAYSVDAHIGHIPFSTNQVCTRWSFQYPVHAPHETTCQVARELQYNTALIRRNVPATFCHNPSPQCVDRTSERCFGDGHQHHKASSFCVRWINFHAFNERDCHDDQTSVSSCREAWIIRIEMIMADNQVKGPSLPDVIPFYYKD